MIKANNFAVNRVFAALFVFLVSIDQPPALACTTAAWSAHTTADHVPIMWKNRDTDGDHNQVVFMDQRPYRYLGLGDSGAGASRGVFAGLNEVGFAIFNTVAYNLPQLEHEAVDREGLIMAEALRSIASVEEFERFIAGNLGPKLGAKTNFVVGDASGAIWVFEVHNHGYSKYPVHSKPEGYNVVTNFSLSGVVGAGTGYMRFERAKSLIEKHHEAVDVDFILTTLARDFFNPLLHTPTVDDLRDMSSETPHFHATIDTIDRESTVATAIIQGKKLGDGASLATFWVTIGEPLSSLAVPLWVEAGAVPEALASGDPVPMQSASLRIKSLLRPLPYPEQYKYMNLSLLVNSEGTGVLPQLHAAQAVILVKTRDFLATSHSPAELRDFQDSMAAFALARLEALAAVLPSP